MVLILFWRIVANFFDDSNICQVLLIIYTAFLFFGRGDGQSVLLVSHLFLIWLYLTLTL